MVTLPVSSGSFEETTDAAGVAFGESFPSVMDLYSYSKATSSPSFFLTVRDTSGDDFPTVSNRTT